MLLFTYDIIMIHSEHATFWDSKPLLYNSKQYIAAQRDTFNPQSVVLITSSLHNAYHASDATPTVDSGMQKGLE